MSFDFRKSGKAEAPVKTFPKWLPPVLWAAALLCVGFMGIVMVQRTPMIRGTNGIIIWEELTRKSSGIRIVPFFFFIISISHA